MVPEEHAASKPVKYNDEQSNSIKYRWPSYPREISHVLNRNPDFAKRNKIIAAIDAGVKYLAIAAMRRKNFDPQPDKEEENVRKHPRRTKRKREVVVDDQGTSADGSPCVHGDYVPINIDFDYDKFLSLLVRKECLYQFDTQFSQRQTELKEQNHRKRKSAPASDDDWDHVSDYGEDDNEDESDNESWRPKSVLLAERKLGSSGSKGSYNSDLFIEGYVM